MQTPRRARVILAVDKYRVPLLILLAQAVFAAMSAHAALFASLSALIATLGTQTTDLVDAQSGVKNKTVGTAERNAKRDLVVTTLESLRALIQALCDASPEQAATLIQAAAMKAAAVRARAKAMLAVTLGVQSGVVDLVANARLLSMARRSKTYNWQFTTDGGRTWSAAASTPYARTTLGGLPPLIVCGFRVNVVVGDDEPGPWSQTVSILVH
jgi:hypothetical protein